MSELSREVALRPEQSALLVIDVQNFCAHPEGAEFGHLSAAERQAQEGYYFGQIDQPRGQADLAFWLETVLRRVLARFKDEELGR